MKGWNGQDLKDKGYHGFDNKNGIAKKLSNMCGTPPKKVKAKKEVSKFAPYIGSEDDFQQAVARYLDSLGILWTHIANERKTDIKTNSKGVSYSASGARLKAKGVKRGVPDILIFEPSVYVGFEKHYVGFAIELKVGKNSTSSDQKVWIGRLATKGWKCLVSKSLDEVIFEVDFYIKKIKYI